MPIIRSPKTRNYTEQLWLGVLPCVAILWSAYLSCGVPALLCIGVSGVLTVVPGVVVASWMGLWWSMGVVPLPIRCLVMLFSSGCGLVVVVYLGCRVTAVVLCMH